jgi:hypothetical protein
MLAAFGRNLSLTQNAVNETERCNETRHARPCAGYPRLGFTQARKTWMAGTSPAMTKKSWEAHPLGKSLRIAISAASPGESTLPSNAGWRWVTMS